MPKVSVVIPCYHAAPFINTLLDSLARQAFQDFEVIAVVDDLDYDSTVCMVRSHSVGSKTTIFGSTRKTSPAKARNTGVKYSVGKYIAFCDADDWWDPLKLDVQVKHMDTHPEWDVTYTRCMAHYPNSPIVKISGTPFSKEELWRGCPAPFSSVMVRAGIAKLYPFNEKLKGLDDYAWLLQLDEHWAHIKFIPTILTHALYHGGNLTAENSAAYKQTMYVHFSRGEYYTGIYKYLMPKLVDMKARFFQKGTWRLNK
jgi:glycosyltransferase involved in cell wall biosynthesis